MRIFAIMKTRLNLTIDDALLDNIKAYASNKQTSVSELVENYFKAITKPAKRKNIINLVEKLEKPKIDSKADLKELYYQDQSKKYGF
jgi:hypothetical protein